MEKSVSQVRIKLISIIVCNVSQFELLLLKHTHGPIPVL